MPYSKVMAKENFMSSLYKNSMNLTLEVFDLCMHAFTSIWNHWSKRKFWVHNFKAFKVLAKYWRQLYSKLYVKTYEVQDF